MYVGCTLSYLYCIRRSTVPIGCDYATNFIQYAAKSMLSNFDLEAWFFLCYKGMKTCIFDINFRFIFPCDLEIFGVDRGQIL